MRDLRLVMGLGGAMALVVAATSGCSKAVAQTPSKVADRDIELTVYKDDFAMVSEQRPVSVDSGSTKIAIDDVSKTLDPKSILYEWPGMQKHPNVVATTYNVGAGRGTSMIGRLNGQEVRLMLPSSNGQQGEIITGRLEASQEGNGFSLRTPERLYVDPVGTIIASPNTASAQPQLSVELKSSAAAKTKLGMSYLTSGMSWSADYVAKLNPNQNTAELECWATVSNGTGIPFPAAKVTLMAGSLNHRLEALTLSPSTVVGGTTSNGTVTLSAARSSGGINLASNAPRQAVGELYAYEIPAKATIGVDQMNRVSVLGTRTVPVKKNYTVQLPTLGSWGYANGAFDSTGSPHIQATFSLSFVDNGASNLGVPLPSGEVRVYEKDNAGRERYTGSDTIQDTPKGEHVNLNLSNAFDVYGSFKVLKSERIKKHKLRKTVEISLFNEKKTEVQLKVVQDFSNTWVLDSESAKSEKLDTQSIQWKPTLKPSEARKITFTVDLKD